MKIQLFSADEEDAAAAFLRGDGDSLSLEVANSTDSVGREKLIAARVEAGQDSDWGPCVQSKRALPCCLYRKVKFTGLECTHVRAGCACPIRPSERLDQARSRCCSTQIGTVNQKVDPFPRCDSTPIRPPCSSTIF